MIGLVISFNFGKNKFIAVISILLIFVQVISIEMMQTQENIFQCPYCGYDFNQNKRRPMILCMSQHTACETCVESLFKGVKKQSQPIDCPFRCSKIYYNDIKNFRYLNQIIQTKEKLNRVGSTLKKELNSFNTDKKMLLEELQKERAKNEWLIQINERREKSQKEIQKKMVLQMKKQMEKQRFLLQDNFQKALDEMQKRNKQALQKELKAYEPNKDSKDKIVSVIETKIQSFEKQLTDQMSEFKTIKKQLQQFQVLKKMIIKISNSQDQKLKLEKKDEEQMKKQLKINDEFYKEITKQKHEEKKEQKEGQKKAQKKQQNKQQKQHQKNVEITNPQSQRKTLKQIGRIKSQKQLQLPKNNLGINKNNYLLPPNQKFRLASLKGSPFMKKNSEPNILEGIKPSIQKEQSMQYPNKYEKLIEANRPRAYTNKNQPSLRMNTQPNERSKDEMNQINPLRASMDSSMFQKMGGLNFNYRGFSPKASGQKNSFKAQNKYNANYQSTKYLNSRNNSVLQYSKAQQNKISTIIQKLKKKYGPMKIASKQLAIKKFIDQRIHLSQEEILQKYASQNAL